MPNYDYKCPACNFVEEIVHAMSKNPKITCSACMTKMERMISCSGYVITGGVKGSLKDHKEAERTKKVKDPERAVKSRKRAFGSDAVGDPGMTTDPRHVIKRGRTLGGQQKEVDKAEFIKAVAKDDYAVAQAIKVVNKKAKKEKK